MVEPVDLETVGFRVDPDEVGESDEFEPGFVRIVAHGCWLLVSGNVGFTGRSEWEMIGWWKRKMVESEWV